MTGPYDDIIDLPHHVSSRHPRMSLANRAAQFSPFAALTGHDAAIKETARLTNERLILDENTLAILDRKLQMLRAMINQRPEITVTYFLADQKKDGGIYVTSEGLLCKVDDYEHRLILNNGETIAIADIIELESDALRGLL